MVVLLMLEVVLRGGCHGDSSVSGSSQSWLNSCVLVVMVMLISSDGGGFLHCFTFKVVFK